MNVADLEPNAEGALAQLEKLPAPLANVGSFLRRPAAGDLPAVPSGLPDELRQLLDQHLTAVREAKPWPPRARPAESRPRRHATRGRH